MTSVWRVLPILGILLLGVAGPAIPSIAKSTEVGRKAYDCPESVEMSFRGVDPVPGRAGDWNSSTHEKQRIEDYASRRVDGGKGQDYLICAYGEKGFTAELRRTGPRGYDCEKDPRTKRGFRCIKKARVRDNRD